MLTKNETDDEKDELSEEWDISLEEILEENEYEELSEIEIELNEIEASKVKSITNNNTKSQESIEVCEEVIQKVEINDSNTEEMDIRKTVKGKEKNYTTEQDIICVLKKGYIANEEYILVDSGATSHISNDESMFVSYNKDFIPSKHTVELADGSRESFAEKKGEIWIQIKDEVGEIQDIYLSEVLFCPSFPQKIFSVKSATKADEGSKVILDSKGGEIVSSKGTRFPIISTSFPGKPSQ